MTVPGESLEYYVFGGANLTDVLKGYTDLTGKPSLPPAFSFGLWLTTSFTTIAIPGCHSSHWNTEPSVFLMK